MTMQSSGTDTHYFITYSYLVTPRVRDSTKKECWRTLPDWIQQKLARFRNTSCHTTNPYVILL